MMETNTIHCGDAWDLAKTLAPNSINLICCSPPYWGLRDYSTGQWEGGSAECDHLGPPKPTQAGFNERYFGKEFDQNKQAELRVPYRDLCGKCGARRIDAQAGLEATPELFIAKLVTLFRDLRTALHPTGQCFINISDTRSDDRQWLGIPHRLVFALVADGWRYEDEIIWSKLNPMPGSQTNRFTRSHEFVFMLNKSRDAFFDGEAVREPNSPTSHPGTYRTPHKNEQMGVGMGQSFQVGKSVLDYTGRMRRTVWSIATQPLGIAHYAAYPTALVRPMIEAGSSAYGCCPNCLAPWVRVVERGNNIHPGSSHNHAHDQEQGNTQTHASGKPAGTIMAQRWYAKTPDVTTGWAASCTCEAGQPIPALVLDPFCGSGTTAVVAVSLGRRYVGFELNESYVEMAESRLAETQPALIAAGI